MVAFSFILCLSIMHQDASSVDYTIPSYRPLTYVVCKNMSMSEMEKPSIQSFKVTIDHTHGHMKRKFSFLKQTYIFTVQNALHIVSMMEAQIQKSKIITYTLWNWEPIKYSTYNVHMSFVHFIDNLAATLFRIFWPHNDVGTYLDMLLICRKSANSYSYFFLLSFFFFYFPESFFYSLFSDLVQRSYY